MVKRDIVGAHYGLRDWLVQRVTAVVMAAFAVVIAVALLQGVGTSYESWRAFMSSGLMRFVSFVFVVSLCWHAWVGVRDIWMDYVKSPSVKLLLHVLTILALVGYAGWAVQIIWRL